MDLRVLTMIAALALGGCASSGAGDTPVGAARDRTTTVIGGRAHQSTQRVITDEQAITGLMLADRDFGWQRLPGIFEQLGIEVTHSDPSNYTMGTRAARVRRIDGERPARFLDCGYGSTAQPYANEYEVTMGLMVNLTTVEEGTQVTVRIDASAKPRAVSGHAVNCSSKGTLERRILTLISPE